MHLIPKEGYEKVSFGSFVDSFTGYAFKTTEYIQSGIPILSIKNIREPFVEIKDSVYVKESERYDQYQIHRNDLLIGLTGGKKGEGKVGKIGIMTKDEKYYLNQRVLNIRPKEGYHSYFIYSLYKIFRIQDYLISLSNGTNQQNISETDVLNSFVLVPTSESRKAEWISEMIHSLQRWIESPTPLHLQMYEELIDQLYHESIQEIVYGSLEEIQLEKNDEVESISISSSVSSKKSKKKVNMICGFLQKNGIMCISPQKEGCNGRCGRHVGK